MKKISVTIVIFLFLTVVVQAQTDSPLPPPGPTPDPLPEPTGSETLRLVLLWLVGGGGGGVVAYWLMAKLGLAMDLSSENKRYVSLALAASVACLAYVAAVVIGYTAQPPDWRGWLEELFAVAYLSVTFSQAVHGWRKLSTGR